MNAADDSSSSSLDPNDADVAFAFTDFEGVDFGEDEVAQTPRPRSEEEEDRPINHIIAQLNGGEVHQVEFPSGQDQEDAMRAHNPELFELQRLRVRNLTLWYELGTRPDMTRTPLNVKAHVDDGDLLSCTKDDLSALLVRLMEAHDEMNSNLPRHKLSKFEDALEVRDSTIRDAGKGLFSKVAIPSGAAVCYYSGYRHTYQSQKRLRDRTYVLKLQNGWPKHDRRNDGFIDALPTPSVKARYINDPMNEDKCNVKFEHIQEPDIWFCPVISQRDILPGEELFVSYGPRYWNESRMIGG